MNRIDLQIGDRVRLEMPWSEVMMHLRLAGSNVVVEVLDDGVQLLLEDGTKLSFPVTWAEAGIYTDTSGPYAYGGHLVGGPNCTRVFFAFTQKWADTDPVTAVFIDHVAVDSPCPQGVRLGAYAHVGQHVQVCWQWMHEQPAATPEQYAPLLRELTAQGIRAAVVDSFDRAQVHRG